ncbi:MAG TPA: MFS transporter [Caulobacteraceae bacterium]
MSIDQFEPAPLKEEFEEILHPPAADTSVDPKTWLPPPVAWYAVCMISLVTLCGQLDYGLMSLLVQPIKASTHMTDSQIGLLMGAAYSAAYLCCGVPLARISDRRRRTFVLTGAMTVWSIGTALCGLVMSFWPFALCRGIMGGAISVKGPTTVSIMPDLVPREKLARAFGIYNVCLIAGQSLSLIAGGLLLGVFGRHMPIHLLGFEIKHAWQMVFVAMGLPGLVVAAIVVTTVPEPKRHGARRESVPMREVAHFIFRGPASRVFVPTMIGTALAGILLAGYGGWRAAFFARTYHMGAHVYGPIAGSLGLITAPIGVIIGAWVAERMHKRWIDSHLRLALIVHALTMPFYVLGTLMPTATLALGCQFVMGVLMMVSAPSLLSAMQIITPNEMRAQVNAVYMITISVVGNGLGPSVVAFMTDFIFRDPGQLRYAMMALAAVVTPIGLVCTWLTVKPYGRLYQQVKDAEAAQA